MGPLQRVVPRVLSVLRSLAFCPTCLSTSVVGIVGTICLRFEAQSAATVGICERAREDGM